MRERERGARRKKYKDIIRDRNMGQRDVERESEKWRKGRGQRKGDGAGRERE